jgi:hypothetical protein
LLPLGNTIGRYWRHAPSTGSLTYSSNATAEHLRQRVDEGICNRHAEPLERLSVQVDRKTIQPFDLSRFSFGKPVRTFPKNALIAWMVKNQQPYRRSVCSRAQNIPPAYLLSPLFSRTV